jgi:hypothetical protein
MEAKKSQKKTAVHGRQYESKCFLRSGLTSNDFHSGTVAFPHSAVPVGKSTHILELLLDCDVVALRSQQ